MSGYLKLKVVEGKNFKSTVVPEVKSRGFFDKKSKKDKSSKPPKTPVTPPSEEEVTEVTPIIQLKFKNESCSTKPCHIKTDELAKWDEIFEFKLEEDEYSFMLIVYNGEIKDDCVLGESRIGVITFKDQKKLDNWFPFYMKNKKKFILMGEIRLIAKYIEDSEHDQQETDPDFIVSKPEYINEYDNNHGNYLGETGFVLNNNSEDYYDTNNYNNINVNNGMNINNNNNNVMGNMKLSCSPSDMTMLNQQNINGMKTNANNNFNGNYQNNNTYQNYNSTYQNNGTYQNNSTYQNNTQDGGGYILPPSVYNNNYSSQYSMMNDNNGSLPRPGPVSPARVPNNRINVLRNKNNNNNNNMIMGNNNMNNNNNNNNVNISHLPSFLNPQVFNRNNNNNNGPMNSPSMNPMNSVPMNSVPMSSMNSPPINPMNSPPMNSMNGTYDTNNTMPIHPQGSISSVHSQGSMKYNGSEVESPVKGDSIYSSNSVYSTHDASVIDNTVLPVIPDELAQILSDIPSPDLTLPQEEIMEQLESRLKYKQYNQRVSLNSKQINEFKAWSERIQQDNSISHADKKQQLRTMKEKHSNQSKQLAQDHQHQLDLLHEFLDATKNAARINENAAPVGKPVKNPSVSSQHSQKRTSINGSVNNNNNSKPVNNSVDRPVFYSLDRPNSNYNKSRYNSTDRPVINSLDRPKPNRRTSSLVSELPTVPQVSTLTNSLPNMNMNMNNSNNNQSMYSMYNNAQSMNSIYNNNNNNNGDDFGFSLKYINRNHQPVKYTSGGKRQSIVVTSDDIFLSGNQSMAPQECGFNFGPMMNTSNRPTKEILVKKTKYYNSHKYVKNYDRSNIKFKTFKATKSYAPNPNYTDMELKKKLPEVPKKDKYTKKLSTKIETQKAEEEQQKLENINESVSEVDGQFQEPLSDDEPLIGLKNKLEKEKKGGEGEEEDHVSSDNDSDDLDGSDDENDNDEEKKDKRNDTFNLDDASFGMLGVDINIVGDSEFEQLLNEYNDINDRIQKMKTVKVEGEDLESIQKMKTIKEEEIKRILTAKKIAMEKEKEDQDSDSDSDTDSDDSNNEEEKVEEEKKEEEEEKKEDEEEKENEDIELQHESTIKASSINKSSSQNSEIKIEEDDVSKIIENLKSNDDDDEFKEMLGEYDDINCQLQKMNTVKTNISISNSLKDFYAELGISPTIKSPKKENVKKDEE